MKRTTILFCLALFTFSCSNYTPEQGEAADFMCECMSDESIDDIDILYYKCNEESKAKFDKTIYSDEGYAKALNEKCPELNLVSEES
ncbi:hypothetical protein DNU06_16635 [Putridiphycobacter roseus]|uniref:Lipoprotein n=1 Tax=Putridiphycobacter roseus TaxID=2219161 RepID=A0A2W1N9K4_9FLAO|nr:hypothetical protein [Putridiphycobacter roseus]PZE15723.1 hypothetical protein DNU06_16635 [Putridiphycobacter roseus]